MATIYRKISVQMWADEKFRHLSPSKPCGQFLWVWLISGPETCQIPGVVIGGPATLAESIGWPPQEFQKALDECVAASLLRYDASSRLMFLPKGINHNPPVNPNVVKSWATTWNLIPECELKAHIWCTFKSFLEPLHKSFLPAFFQTCGKASVNPLPIQEQEQETGTGAGGGSGGNASVRKDPDTQATLPGTPDADPPSATASVSQIWPEELRWVRVTVTKVCKRFDLPEAFDAKYWDYPGFWKSIEILVDSFKGNMSTHFADEFEATFTEFLDYWMNRKQRNKDMRKTFRNQVKKWHDQRLGQERRMNAKKR